MARAGRTRRGGRAGRTALALGVLLTISALAAVGAVTVIGSLGKGSNASELERYIAEDDPFELDLGGFTVDLPAEPERDREQVPLLTFAGPTELTGERWQVKAEAQTVFDVLALDRPAFRDILNSTDPDVIITSILLGQVEALEGRRSRIDGAPSATLPSNDARIRYRKKVGDDVLRFTMHARVLVADTRVFILRLATSFDGGRPEAFFTLARSFEVNPDA